MTSKEAGLQSDDDLFKLLSKLLTRSREWVAARWNISHERHENDDVQVVVDHHVPRGSTEFEASAGSANVDGIPDLDGIPWIQAMDLESDKWFEDVLGWSPIAY